MLSKALKKQFGKLICADCGVEEAKNGPSQRYCKFCSTKRDIIRKSKWATANPKIRTPEENIKRYKETRSQSLEQGKAIAAQNVRNITWFDNEEPKLLWVSRFKYPYSQALSKNHIYSNTPYGHVFMRTESTKAKNDIALLVRSAVKGHPIKNNKVWIDLLVQKPNQRSDAINVVDLVCDGIKIGLGVDDRWFSIRRLDWEISKSDPQVFIGIGQEDIEDVIVCSSCGRLLTFDNFTKNRSIKLGIGRNCKDCRRKPTSH